MRTIVLGLMLIAVAVSGLALVRQSPETKPAQAQEAKAKPGAAEMKRVGFYVGNWTYTETYPESAMAPQGATNTGVYTSKLGPGGNSLLNTFHSKGPAGDFEGMLVMTWDLAEQKYKMYVFGDGFPGAIVETGGFEEDKLVFRGEFPGRASIKLRNTTWLEASGKLISEQYVSSNGAPEKLLVKVEASRQ
ncbi:MAG TPA: hypothetical protein VGJ30_15040 [Candidatus Angelobacter sp.]